MAWHWTTPLPKPMITLVGKTKLVASCVILLPILCLLMSVLGFTQFGSHIYRTDTGKGWAMFCRWHVELLFHLPTCGHPLGLSSSKCGPTPANFELGHGNLFHNNYFGSSICVWADFWPFLYVDGDVAAVFDRQIWLNMNPTYSSVCTSHVLISCFISVTLLLFLEASFTNKIN